MTLASPESPTTATVHGAPDGAGPQERPVVALRRRVVDRVLVGLGAVAAVVLVVAGGLLSWGSSFAEDYVHDELVAQRITFPDAESLAGQGRDDLVGYAGTIVDDGDAAEAYASYIDGHLAATADGATYADLGPAERATAADVQAAIDAGADDAEVARLQAIADDVTAQRDTLFRGETLRGLLLSTYAWSTVGRIAGIAAVVSFVGAGVTFVLVALGLVHLRRGHQA